MSHGRRHPARRGAGSGWPVSALLVPALLVSALLVWLWPMAAWADPVVLQRGINLTNWFRYPASTETAALNAYIGVQALADLHSAGFDFVRLAVDPDLAQHPALLPAIRRIQHAGLTVVIVPHPRDWHLETSASDRQKLLDFWQDVSVLLRPLDPKRTVPEILNEPVFPGDPAAWASLQHAALLLIRHNLPRSTVVLTGQDWGSIGGLLGLEPDADANVLYSFHFYEPAELTSLAAYRHDVDRLALTQLPFPVQDDCSVPTTDAPTRDLVAYYCALHWDEPHIRASIKRASAWARIHGVRLLAGEFGATAEVNAAARLAWIRTVRASLETEAIAWALWGYDDSMGFALQRPPGPRPRLDPDLLSALGLHNPI